VVVLWGAAVVVVVAAGCAADAAFTVTTTDHLPHLSVNTPVTCPRDLSPTNL
jgi:hypothetical protein